MRNTILGLALLTALTGSGCSAVFAEHRTGPRYESAYDLGFRNGYRDGAWAGHRDLGKRYRASFWDDGRYRRAEEGYRVRFGSRSQYSSGFRAGYEQGYYERRIREWRQERRFQEHRHPGQSRWCRDRH